MAVARRDSLRVLCVTPKLAPAYLNFAPGPRSASLMTIHNAAFQGIFPAATLSALGLPAESYSSEGVEYYGNLSFLKAGIYDASPCRSVSESRRTAQFHCWES